MGLAAPGWPAGAALGTPTLGAPTLGAPTLAASPSGARPPGVPPPVDMALLPNPNDEALIGARPYDASTTGQNPRHQTGGPSQENRSCVTREQAGAPTVEDIPPGQFRMRLPELRKFGRGAGQLIAVVDTGVNQHPRLAGRLVDGGDYVLGQNPFADCDGHGTIVAGIIAASDDPKTGFTGVAPDAQIISVRQSSQVLQVKVQDERSPETSLPAGDTTTMARAIVHAVNLGAKVINISEAACVPVGRTVNGHAQDLQAAVHYAAAVKNVVVVAAAGNVGQTCPQNDGVDVGSVASPAWFDDDVLTVAAIDSTTSQAADFSLHGPWVDVAAPGTAITSLDPASDQLANQTIQNNQVGPIVGTSFATPYVTGLAALIRERYPNLNAHQVMRRIEKTTQQTASKNGRNNQIGHGVVDPIAALTAVIPEEHGSTPAPVSPAKLDNLIPPPQKDPLPTRVALIGSATALGLLGLTALIVFTAAASRPPK
jgi:membrane-anchored mycosin MYCP